ncbi:hypothetical protein D3C85_770720 [compost metagenome]
MIEKHRASGQRPRCSADPQRPAPRHAALRQHQRHDQALRDVLQGDAQARPLAPGNPPPGISSENAVAASITPAPKPSRLAAGEASIACFYGALPVLQIPVKVQRLAMEVIEHGNAQMTLIHLRTIGILKVLSAALLTDSHPAETKNAPEWARLQIRRRAAQLPATVIFSISTEPVRMLPRSSRSLPTASTWRNMSLRLPAMVTSCTGNWISPFSTQ